MSEPPAEHQGEPTYGAPYPSPPPQAYGQPPVYGQPVSASPYSYGPPVSAVPPQPTGSALQPYSPAVPAAHYAQPYPSAQVSPYPLVSAGGRLGAVLLDLLLAMITLWIGWFIWSMITWSDGQSPGKKLLGHVVVDANTGQPLDWGRMALRELCVKGLVGSLLSAATCSIYVWVDAFMVLGDRQRTAHDRMANSIVRHV